jgi:periplasmic divalent cation tolerance protein
MLAKLFVTTSKYVLAACGILFLTFIWAPYLLQSPKSAFASSSLANAKTMSGATIRAVLVTVPSLEVGKKIAEGVVKNKLAACVNIIPQVTSIYEWEGKVTEDSELLLIIKTQESRFEELSSFVQANHPYDVPEVIALPIDQGSKSYLDWVKKQTTPN